MRNVKIVKLLDSNNNFNKLKSSYLLQEPIDLLDQRYIILCNGMVVGGFILSSYIDNTIKGLWDFFIVEDYQNLGIATEALLLLIQELKVSNILKLILDVNPNNLIAIKLYKKLGFKDTGQKRKEYCNYELNLMDA